MLTASITITNSVISIFHPQKPICDENVFDIFLSRAFRFWNIRKRSLAVLVRRCENLIKKRGGLCPIGMHPSKAMGRKVHLWCYVHFGPPVFVFPSAAGFAHEWQQHGMIELLRPLLNAGRIKLYCPESNVAQAWTRKEGSLEERMHHHSRYEQFILHELRAFIASDCHMENPSLSAIGCSLGAMYAANFALKFPTVFRHSICMSGRYLTTELTDGENSSSLCFNNPLAYVPNLSGAALEIVQKVWG